MKIWKYELDEQREIIPSSLEELDYCLYDISSLFNEDPEDEDYYQIFACLTLEDGKLHAEYLDKDENYLFMFSDRFKESVLMTAKRYALESIDEVGYFDEDGQWRNAAIGSLTFFGNEDLL